MATAVRVAVPDLKRIIKKTDPAILRAPLRTFFKKAAILIQGESKKKAPVDTGHLRASLNYSIDKSSLPLWAKVGTNVFYAPYIEFGTGTQAIGTPKKGGRHFPPSDALERWASRHGFGPGGGFVVARAIGRRGGLKPREFLTGAFRENVQKIRGFLGDVARDIERNWR